MKVGDRGGTYFPLTGQGMPPSLMVTFKPTPKGQERGSSQKGLVEGRGTNKYKRPEALNSWVCPRKQTEPAPELTHSVLGRG